MADASKHERAMPVGEINKRQGTTGVN